MNAQTEQYLNIKEKGIVNIALFTAIGDQVKLKAALGSGLDAGLSINEIKEVLLQLYAYCGFPRSLNALNTFISSLDERKGMGKQDPTGAEPNRVSAENKYEQGRETLEKLTGVSQKGPLTGANAFAPGIDQFLKEHLFADIFGRGLLTYQERELATITTLACLPGLESQLASHLGMGTHVGIPEGQLRDIFRIVGREANPQRETAANTILSEMLKKD